MNLTLVKSTLWLGSLGVFGWLGWTLYEFKTHEAERTSRKVDADYQAEKLDSVPEPQVEVSDLVDYDRVVASFHELNWTGKKPPPPPPPPVKADEKPTRVVKPIEDLLMVLYIQVDSTDSAESMALARAVDPKLVPNGETNLKLHEGDSLTGYSYWEVAAVESEGVRFRYVVQDDEDPGREDEWALPPTPTEGQIVEVGEGGEVLAPTFQSQISEAAPGTYSASRPQRTIEVSPGRYRLGEEDLTEIGENYLDILGNELRTRPWRNPKTGEWGGIQISSVAPGSIASQHGAQDGDIVISINGHPVNSPNEAISYAKQNKDVYSVWNVVVLSAGVEKTLVFETDERGGSRAGPLARAGLDPRCGPGQQSGQVDRLSHSLLGRRSAGAAADARLRRGMGRGVALGAARRARGSARRRGRVASASRVPHRSTVRARASPSPDATTCERGRAGPWTTGSRSTAATCTRSGTTACSPPRVRPFGCGGPRWCSMRERR